ncbi:Glycosyl-phosphatidyl inositol-anchored, plant [Cynara cardunculus var. scolymus]|uniref:Glycosyl-phosphatidyl inositol-anchored, plant n=1 Tax=Cynara cardunculus var. scolymus TaxID=59895 RepID=A0A103YJR7_CYNCS|nr:Glycosyl-phosphatidyl inositol-anchored, plant [Cynara cardunculus var. scolymus]
MRWKKAWVLLLVFQIFTRAQDDGKISLPKEVDTCNGIFLLYTFDSRQKEYPRLKNATAQSWAFKSQLSVVNAGTTELKSWQAFIGFQHDEILVSIDGAMPLNAQDFPMKVGNNGTHLTGYPHADLKTAIETAGDLTQMSAIVKIKGTMFGVRLGGNLMPTKIKLENQGFKCPAAKTKGQRSMHVCCTKDPKYKEKKKKPLKFFPRRKADLSFTYDITQAYKANYMAEVTIENNHPLGRLDHWNLSFEWMRNEFIYDMRGAFPRKKDPSECLYSAAGQYYQDMDFSKVINCQKRPIISDLPPTLKNDEKVGKLPFCCRDGIILPKIMNATKSRSVFQMNVFKLPPDLNRTTVNPPQNWNITGMVNPHYRCSQPVRVDPTETPDPSGVEATISAIASFQVTCNITKPKPKMARCCVSFSAYYAESVVPCNTCACGCEDENPRKCDEDAPALPLPSEALLVPFANRTLKAKAWAKIKHMDLPRKLPCPDNCPVSLNWHVDSDYKTGWSARMTIFNWDTRSFEDWFLALQFKKALVGFENVYSFNGTKLPKTIFMQGLPGLNYLVGLTNGTKAGEPPVPGKQQSVISFLKKNTPRIRVAEGDGFPSKVVFNGGECALPKRLPKRSAGSNNSSPMGLFSAVFVSFSTFIIRTN